MFVDARGSEAKRYEPQKVEEDQSTWNSHVPVAAYVYGH
jgi:hypothetical protein